MWLARGLTTYKYEKARLDKNLHRFFFLFNSFRFVFKSIPQASGNCVFDLFSDRVQCVHYIKIDTPIHR